jgi:hypothetical protein
MAESLQTADPAAFDGLPVPLVEVAAAQFLVGVVPRVSRS